MHNVSKYHFREWLEDVRRAKRVKVKPAAAEFCATEIGRKKPPSRIASHQANPALRLNLLFQVGQKVDSFGSVQDLL
jgi:hypothetical protein